MARPKKPTKSPFESQSESPYINVYGYQSLRKILPSLHKGPPVSANDLDHLLDFLAIKKHLNGFLLTLQNLPRIADKAYKICDTPKWRHAVRLLKDAEETGAILYDNQGFIKSKVRHLGEKAGLPREQAFHGAITDSPYYTTLGHLSKERYNNQYYNLCAQILVANLLTIRKGKREILAKSLSRALDATRTLASTDALRDFPEDSLSPEAYLDRIQGIDNKDKAPIVSYLSKVQALSQASGIKEFGELVLKSATQKRVKDYFEALYPLELLSEQLPEIYEELEQSEDENRPSPPGHIFVVAKPAWAFLSKAEFASIANGLTNSRSMGNQFFHFAWSNLNQHSLQVLYRYLFVCQPTNNQEIATRSQLGLLLMAGLTPSRLAAIELASCDMPQPATDVLSLSPPILKLYSPGPTLKTTLNPKAISQTYPTQSYIDLPLPDYLTRLIGHYLNNHTEAQDNLFLESPETIQQLCTRALSKLNRENNTHLTLTRVQNYMERKIASLQESDVAVSSLALGKEIYTARTRIHYASLDVDNLKQLCHKAWLQTARDAGLPVQLDVTSPDQPSVYVGTPLRPKLEVVRDLLERLKNDLRRKKPAIKNLEDMVDYHNDYVLYTTLMIAYCTGYRAVNSPYITEDMYDPVTGFCVIRDKSSADFYHCRLVWLPEECRKHLEFFEEHLKQIRKRSRYPIPNSNRKDGVFFLLTPDGRRETVTRTKIQNLLEKFNFHLPPNTQRHFLKSNLQENGCPIEIIEILLGHWFAGQEGWTQTSALHPWDFKKEVEKHLCRLLDDIGLTALQGLEQIPSTIHLKLHHKTAQETSGRTSPNPNRLDKKNKTFLTENPPGEVWHKILGNHFKNLPAGEAFKPQERVVLLKVHALLPDLYAGKPIDGSVPTEVLKALLRRLQPRPMRHRLLYKRLHFLINGLEWGKEHLGWQVDIPNKPIIMAKEFNRVRPSLIRKLKIFRQAEQILLRDLKHPLSNKPEAQVGQIIVSAVLYGSIHHQSWLEGFTAGLAQGIYQHGELLWVDLWSQPLSFQSPMDKWATQRNPALYRRWLADPTTQLLIYRWQDQYPDNQPATVFKLEEVYSKYSAYLMQIPGGTQLPPLKDLLTAGNAWATLNTPQFLAAYAANKILSASLPDPAWMRLLTGQRYSFSMHGKDESLAEDKEIIKDEELATIPPMSSDINQQLDLLGQLQRCLTKSENPKEEVKNFLKKHEKLAWENLKLLAEWSIRMLSERVSEKEKRHISAVLPKTIHNYLGQFAPQLLKLGGDISLCDLEDDIRISLLTKIVEGIDECKFADLIHPSKGEIEKTQKVLERINQFLGYLHFVHDLPNISLQLDNSKITILPGECVRANLVSPNEYHMLLDRLGWKQSHLTRLERMTLVVAILSYRTGMRPAETYGLLIGDIQGSDRLELLVQPNWIRRLKTRYSQRRIPLYILLPPDELAYIRAWHEFRATELRATPKSPLFTLGPVDLKPCPYQYLYTPLTKALREVTGDPAMVPYILRHTFATWLLLSLQLREDIDTGKGLPFLKDPWLAPANMKKRKILLLENETTGRKSLYAGAALMGHADTYTEIYSYNHLCDWLTWYYTRHPSCCPELPAKALEQIVSCHPKTAPRIMRAKKTGTHPLLSQVRSKSKNKNIYPRELKQDDTPIAAPPSRQEKAHKEPFDVLLHRLYTQQTLPDSLRWPRWPVEFWLLRHLYESLGNFGKEDLRKFQTVFPELFACYKQYENTLVVDDLPNGGLTVDLLKRLNVEMSIQHQWSRWAGYQSSQTALNLWQEQLDGIHVWRANRDYGRNVEAGAIRIALHEIKIDGHDLEIDRRTGNVFGLFFYLLSSPSTS